MGCSASDRQGSNFESCVWREVSSHSSQHPQEVLLAQFSLFVHKGGLKPLSFHFFHFWHRFCKKVSSFFSLRKLIQTSASVSSNGDVPDGAHGSAVIPDSGLDGCYRGCAHAVLKVVQIPAVLPNVCLLCANGSLKSFYDLGFFLWRYCHSLHKGHVKQYPLTYTYTLQTHAYYKFNRDKFSFLHIFDIDNWVDNVSFLISL